MVFKITEDAVSPSPVEKAAELTDAMRKLKPGQSINVPSDYFQKSKNRRAMIAMNCLRIWGKGNFAVRKQEDGSHEAYRIN